jgi:hypothetical protein
MAGPGQGDEGKHGGEVDEGPRDRCDRNSAADGAVVGVDARPPRTNGPHAADAAITGRQDLRRRGVAKQAEQVGGRPSAQQRALAARQDGGQVARLRRRRTMADTVDPGVRADERPAARAARDLGRGEARRAQPLTRDEAVRGERELRDDPIRRPVLWSHDDHQAGQRRSSPPSGSPPADLPRRRG